MINDRLRFTVLEANTNTVIARDLVVKEPMFSRRLSAPCTIQFKIPQSERFASAMGINWKNWGQWIVAELNIDGVKKIMACGILSKNTVDPATGDLDIEATGFLGYPKGLPWLENFNPIAVDPAEVIQRIWAHVQSYVNAYMQVDVQPSSTGTQMLPGFGFDGSILSFDFFAMFVRAADFRDCGDAITSLARDLPLDLFENAWWNLDGTLHKEVFIAYPEGGFHQDFLSFRLGENVIQAEKAEELEVEPVSDIIIRGWLPGKVYSSVITNADMTRLRRAIMEEDVNINSTERAAAWAHRKLTRRNIPLSFSKIIIDPNHPNAPLGSFDVGDTIYVEARNYPWYGDIEGWHKIIAINYQEGEPFVELEVKVEGAFNYDPIEYDPGYEDEPVEDLNRLSNGYFGRNLSGWTSIQGQWFRVTGFGYDTSGVGLGGAGSVRIDTDDFGEALRSHKFHVTPTEHLKFEVAVRWQEVVCGPTDKFYIKAYGFLDGAYINEWDLDDYVNPSGTHGWEILRTSDWTVPSGINEVAMQLTVSNGVSDGIAWWSSARVVPA